MSIITRRQIAGLLQTIASSHFQINTFGWGDVPELLGRQNTIYPFMMVTPESPVMGEGEVTHPFRISIADRLQKGLENIEEVDSDMYQVLRDVITQIDNVAYQDMRVELPLTIDPFRAEDAQDVYGFSGVVNIIVDENYDQCAIPSDDVPFDPNPPTQICLPALIENSDSTYVVNVASGGSLILPDVDILVVDINDNPLDTSTIPSVKNHIIDVVCNGGTVSNSDSSYSDTVLSGGTITLPDQNIEVDGVLEGDIPSVGTIEIDITDGTNTVTINDVNISGRTVTIEVGVTLSGIVYDFPALSGQWTSYRTGDDGWLAQNGWYDYTRPANPLYIQELDLSLSNYYYRLKHNNVFGNKLRFTDVDGAQVFGTTGDKNLVFIDHLTGLMWTRTRITNANFDTFIDTSLTHSVTVDSVVYNDWVAPNIEIFKQLFMSQSRRIIDGANVIFEMIANGDNKSSTTSIVTTTNGYGIRTGAADNRITISEMGKSANDGGYFCRKHLL